MTFTTLQLAGGLEKSLADWGISRFIREVSNQAADHVAFDYNAATDAADPWPFGTQITVRIGRVPTGQTGQTAAGLPLSGNTSWTGGQTWFVGWRVDNVRTGQAALEKFDYKFAGPWEFFFERLVFRKIRLSWNGTANVAQYQDRVTLGLSANALTGPQNTLPGTATTCLMSIAQQIREIVAYVITQTNNAYGSPQIQLDNISYNSATGVYSPSWDTEGNYYLYANGSAPNCLIPDYITGYSVGGKTSATANLETVLRAPLDTVTSITCAEAMRKMLRWIGALGSPVVWFDYTASPPTLHIGTRDLLNAVSLPFPAPDSSVLTGPTGPFYATASKIKRRDDLIPSCVALDFSTSGTWNGQQYCYTTRDVAGMVGGTVYEGVGLTGALYTIASAFTGSPAYIGGSAGSATMQALEQLSFGFEGQTTTVDMEGGNSTVAFCTIKTMAINLADPIGGGASLSFWQAVFPELATESGVAFATSAPAVTVVDDSGNPVDTSTYIYMLTDGQIAPWMLAGNAPGGAGAQAVACTISATFTHTENNVVSLSGTPASVPTAHVQNQPKHARVTLVTIPGGTYSRQNISPGEVIPYGLAGYIYNIEKIPQYEGSYTLTETEITDQCPLGNNLNLTGSLAEWSTMNACVQQITYDLDIGRTTLTFGPAAHLGARDFVERLRVNRPPRWYNLQNQNPANDPTQQRGTQLGNNVAQRGPNNGAPGADMILWPAGLTDAASHPLVYTTGIAGATIDVRGAGQPNYGNNTNAGGAPADIAAAVTAGQISTPTKATLHLQDAAAGVYGACIRLSVSDTFGHQMWVQEYPICYDFGDGNGPVAAYILLLGSKPYTSSVHG
jgi:hypothetical protein